MAQKQSGRQSIAVKNAFRGRASNFGNARLQSIFAVLPMVFLSLAAPVGKEAELVSFSFWLPWLRGGEGSSTLRRRRQFA